MQEQVWELEVLPACLRHPMWSAITHLLEPPQCPWCPWLCLFTSAQHFPQTADSATEGPWGSLASSMCYLLVPRETGCLGVETKSWSEAGNWFMPFWMPTVNKHSHPWTIIICAVTAHWRVSMDWPSSIFIHTFDKNTDDFSYIYLVGDFKASCTQILIHLIVLEQYCSLGIYASHICHLRFPSCCI